jgi:hypothetical protein
MGRTGHDRFLSLTLMQVITNTCCLALEERDMLVGGALKLVQHTYSLLKLLGKLLVLLGTLEE